MKPSLAFAVLAATVNALAPQGSQCCFHLTAYGGPGGDVGQLLDGQNRIGDTSLPDGQYCIDSSGGLTDLHGRGCILTPPTKQWQCDAGVAPTPGFSISCNGTLEYAGKNTFYSCPTGQNGGYNIYAEWLKGEPGCKPIWLHSDNCMSGCSVTSTITAPCPTPTTPAPPAKTCPGQLTGDWEFPHLIVPINSVEANKQYGTVFNGTAGGPMWTIFNFDIPKSAAGKTCSLNFLFPEQDQLETSAYTWTGPGKFKFGTLAGVANKHTSYATAPKSVAEFGVFTLTPGSSTYIGKCPHGCPAGQTVSFWMTAADDSSSLNYFQDSNPCPIGLYVSME